MRPHFNKFSNALQVTLERFTPLTATISNNFHSSGQDRASDRDRIQGLASSQDGAEAGHPLA